VNLKNLDYLSIHHHIGSILDILSTINYPLKVDLKIFGLEQAHAYVRDFIQLIDRKTIEGVQIEFKKPDSVFVLNKKWTIQITPNRKLSLMNQNYIGTVYHNILSVHSCIMYDIFNPLMALSWSPRRMLALLVLLRCSTTDVNNNIVSLPYDVIRIIMKFLHHK
jgi:hypothetical protein